MKNVLLVMLLGLLFSSCSIPFLGDDESAESLEKTSSDESQAASVSAPAPMLKEKEYDSSVEKTPMDRFELKLARLWARVDELEERNRKQREKLKILEQGLLLGTVPQELKESLVKIEKESAPKKIDLVKPNPTMDKGEATLKVIDEHSVEKEKMLEAFSTAKNLFRSGRYGKAFLAFSKIEKEYSIDTTQGEEKFWLGRCWHKLRELQSAKQKFEEFITKFPNSPMVASAKFHLGKVSMDMGLKEMAIKQFQEIVREHPYEGAAEAAKQVLANYNNAL